MELGSPQMSQTSGEGTQATRYLLTPRPCHWNTPVPSHPAAQGRALSSELPLKGISPTHPAMFMKGLTPQPQQKNLEMKY